MPLEQIRIDGLRILKGVDCRLHPARNYVLGPNGAGKTSFLEAIYLLGRGRSFRTRHTRRLIAHGSDALTVFAEHRARTGEKRSEEGSAETHRVGVRVDKSGIAYRIDRAPARSVTDAARLFSIEVIDPSVHRLVEAGPSERRRFLDWGVFHVEPNYLELWRRFRRVLGQRNASLKAGSGRHALEPWTRELAVAGEAVSAARADYASKLAAAASATGKRLVGRSLTFAYRAGWRNGLSLAEALAENEERDRALGHTQVGAHRADIELRLDGHPIGEEASRGQQKLAAAALVIAQMRSASAAPGRDAVLLIDDPAAELDPDALERLLNEVGDLRCQLILTGLSDGRLPVEPGFPVFHVEQGRVVRCYNESV